MGQWIYILLQHAKVSPSNSYSLQNPTQIFRLQRSPSTVCGSSLFFALGPPVLDSALWPYPDPMSLGASVSASVFPSSRQVGSSLGRNITQYETHWERR